MDSYIEVFCYEVGSCDLPKSFKEINIEMTLQELPEEHIWALQKNAVLRIEVWYAFILDGKKDDIK